MDPEADIDEITHRLSDVYDVLGNAVRLELLFELDGQRKNVSALAQALNRSQESISRHLKIMRLEDLLESKTEGRERYYWIKKPEVLEKCKEFAQLLRREDDS
ncbi:MAG: ArsR/SmtB family transcription factor [bacterium]